MIPIQFGTSGHRGIRGEGFTLAHVEAIAHGVAAFLLGTTPTPRVVIGYDPREGHSTTLEPGSTTACLVKTLRDCGVDVLYFDHPVPTPYISWYIVHHGLDGGLILTASHNPPEYDGIKFNPANGAPAPKEITDMIQSKANDAYLTTPTFKPTRQGSLSIISGYDHFCTNLIQLATTYFGEHDFSDMSVVVDSKHGTTGPVWKTLFSLLGLTQYQIIHEDPRSDFGGIETNPVTESGVASLKDFLSGHPSMMGIGNDPDGDRHVILDENGQLISPEEVCVIILTYLKQQQIPLKGVVTTLASSSLIRAACLDLDFAETSVGFKYFSPYLEQASQENKLLLAVESSGGFSLSSHTREKCGFLPGLLLLFILNASGKSLLQLKAELVQTYGNYYFKETSFSFLPEQRDPIQITFQTPDLKAIQSSFSYSIETCQTEDGLKLNFSDQSWVLFRLSGTEPVVRLYGESQDEDQTESLLTQASHYFKSVLS